MEFSVPMRIYIEDTDAGGVVFHPNYLKFMERARWEWMHQSGILKVDPFRKERQFMVAKLSIEYLKPMFLDQQIIVTAKVFYSKRVRCVFKQEIISVCRSILFASAVVEIVCVDTENFRPQRLPNFLCSISG
tara:strand:- start:333 stop:728 length:396 start_codon:yes stop_codon:yes gene_type:complete